jgi:phosphoribosylanthranilate isomerase
MTRVKICGITTPEDASLAAELGASAIGMLFWPSSPRVVDRARAREIVAAVPAAVDTVGVFVNQMRDAASIALELGLTAVQLHGDETLEDWQEFPVAVIKAVAVRGAATCAQALGLPGEVTVLLDTHDPVRRGGTGRVVDWGIAAEIARQRRVILSGGLNPDNVQSAIAAVQPYSVDVSSGVESAPGRKDPGKLRALFDALGEGAHGRS